MTLSGARRGLHRHIKLHPAPSSGRKGSAPRRSQRLPFRRYTPIGTRRSSRHQCDFIKAWPPRHKRVTAVVGYPSLRAAGSAEGFVTTTLQINTLLCPVLPFLSFPPMSILRTPPNKFLASYSSRHLLSRNPNLQQ